MKYNLPVFAALATWIMRTTNAPSAGPARLMPLVVE